MIVWYKFKIVNIYFIIGKDYFLVWLYEVID